MPDPTASARPATWQDILDAEAKKQGVDPRLARAMAQTESGMDPTAVSPVGAIGIMQLMPETAKRLGVDPRDPVQNIRGGLTEMRRLLDEHQGDVVAALRGYNASPQAAPTVTDPYVKAVLGRLSGRQEKPTLGRLVGAPPALAAAGGEPQVPPLPSWKPGAIPPPPADAEPGLAGKITRGVVETTGDILSGFDPRTREGRRNLAGAAGATAITTAAVLGAPETGGLSLAALGTLGAGAGGALSEAGEQIAGTAPASSTAVAGAAAQQGLYEAAGQAFVWPVKALGRRIIASDVGRAAHEGLQRVRQASLERLDTALQAASSAAGDVKALASQTVGYARRQAAEAIRSARVGVKADVAAAKTQAGEIVRGAEAPYTSLVAQPPSTAAAGRAAQAQIMGPATEARDRIGQEVEKVAKAGPMIDIRPLKAEAQRILEKIAKPAQAFPRVAPEAVGGDIAGTQSMDLLEQAAAKGDPTALRTLQDMTSALGEAQAEAAKDLLKHPALGVINRVLNADDTVSFYDAHLWKSELQNALQGTYDKAVKSQVTSITQRLAGGLREALAVHEPYNQATAAYAKIAPLYTKEYAAKLRRVALTDPEALVRMIKPTKPTAARMLRDVIVTQSAEGGDAAGGQHAWDLVRSAWTHQNVLKGGIAKLDENLGKLPKEFADVFYGDDSGKAVLANLEQIASAYKAAVGTGEAVVEGAKTAGASRIEQARALGQAAIDKTVQEAEQARRTAAADIVSARLAKRAAKAPTPEEIKFGHSSLAGKQPTLDELAAHGLRAFVLGPTQIWGGLSWLKLLRGPKEKDLIEWAAYSPANTQKLVHLMTGPSPTGMAIADLLRAAGILEPSTVSKAVGAPPPR